MASMLQYLDAVLIDTPILDDNLRKRIQDVHDITDRLARTELFLQYLDNVSDQIRDDEVRTFWRGISSRAKANILDIRERELRRAN